MRSRETSGLSNTVVNSQKFVVLIHSLFVLYNFEFGTVVSSSSVNLACIHIHTSFTQIHFLVPQRYKEALGRTGALESFAAKADFQTFGTEKVTNSKMD